MAALTPTIRPARLADLDHLHRLEVECFGGSALPLSQMRWLLEGQGDAPAFFVRIATEEKDSGADDSAPIGFICWKRRDDPLTPAYEILDLSVGKNFRDERIEHALLENAITEANRENMFGISVNVARSNLAAAAFYLGYQFNPGHIVERYYADGTGMEVFLKRLR